MYIYININIYLYSFLLIIKNKEKGEGCESIFRMGTSYKHITVRRIIETH